MFPEKDVRRRKLSLVKENVYDTKRSLTRSLWFHNAGSEIKARREIVYIPGLDPVGTVSFSRSSSSLPWESMGAAPRGQLFSRTRMQPDRSHLRRSVSSVFLSASRWCVCLCMRIWNMKNWETRSRLNLDRKVEQQQRFINHYPISVSIRKVIIAAMISLACASTVMIYLVG